MNIDCIKRVYRHSLHVACAVLLGVALLPQARADDWNKSTKFTFTDSVQIPGQVLPAGTYWFRLLGSTTDRHVVEIFDEKDQHLIATVIAVPDYHTQLKTDTVLTFAERGGNQPSAIKEWFFAGDRFGEEFVYAKGENLETAKATMPPAPITPPAEAPAEPPPTPAAEATPQVTHEATQPEPQPTPPPVTETPAPAESSPAPAEPESLPKTGGELPLIGLIGIASLGSGLMVRVLRRC